MGYAYYTATGNSALSPNQSCRRAVCCGQANCCGPLISLILGTQVPAPWPRAPKSCVGPSQHCLHQRRSISRTASGQQAANSWKGSRLSRGPDHSIVPRDPGRQTRGILPAASGTDGSSSSQVITRTIGRGPQLLLPDSQTWMRFTGTSHGPTDHHHHVRNGNLPLEKHEPISISGVALRQAM